MALFLSALCLSACGTNQAPTTNAQAETTIRAVLNQWAPDFNSKNVTGVCGLFAPDTVFSYPGAPDRSYEVMCEGFKTQLARTDRTIRYDLPEIQEIIVSGDLAVARLIWTSHISGAGLDGEIVERESGVDVLQKQPDGTWKIHISHAYPIE